MIKEKLALVPNKPGCYLMKNSNDNIVINTINDTIVAKNVALNSIASNYLFITDYIIPDNFIAITKA